KELLTSGVLLLALSFGKIVIAPEKVSIAEVVKDGVSALIYDPSDPDALCASLERATNLSVAERQRISEASYTTALSYDWQHVSEVMYRAIGEVWMKNMNCR
ncbi:MAG: glycosyltransferase, partial [Nitrososphaerales archaeon]